MNRETIAVKLACNALGIECAEMENVLGCWITYDNESVLSSVASVHNGAVDVSSVNGHDYTIIVKGF